MLAALATALGAHAAPAARGQAGVPPEVREHADDWPLPGRDYSNSRATTHSSIDSKTIARLGGNFYSRSTDLFEMPRP